MSLIGGGHNFMTSMSRSSQDNFDGKTSKKSIKYSQSYDVVCYLALLRGKGLRKISFKGFRLKIKTDSIEQARNFVLQGWKED